MKIFQAYYKEEQQAHLDPEFTPYDNTENPVVNLHEYYIYTKIFQEALKTNEDLWGHFSWQWKRKMPGVPAAFIMDHININPGYDVYTFHPFPHETVIHWNVWEQGQWCHPEILKLAERIFTDMDIDPKRLQAPMGTRHYLCANYFVGNGKFWAGMMGMLHQFVDVCGRLPDEYLDLLNSSAGYGDNQKLDYRGFICERLISSFLLMHEDRLKIRPFRELYDARLGPDQRKILAAKDCAIDARSRDFLYDYLALRPPVPEGKTDWGKDWAMTCVL
jgi:hypothetical protein